MVKKQAIILLVLYFLQLYIIDDSTAGQKNVKSDKLSLENGHLTSSHKLATVWPAALFIIKINKGCLIKQPAG